MKRKKNVKYRSPRSVLYYNFDFYKEYAIYKYLCGEWLTKRQRKYLNETNSFIFYSQWEDYVRQKYMDLDVFTLKEFCRYLQHGKRMVEPHNEYWRTTFAAIIGCFFAINFKEVLTDISWINEKTKNIIRVEIFPVFLIMLCIVILIIMVLEVLMYYKKVLSGNLERYFYEDYECIIKDILAEKK